MYYSISIPNGLPFDTFLSLIFVVISSRSCIIGGGLKEKNKSFATPLSDENAYLKSWKKLEILVCKNQLMCSNKK